MFCCAFFPPLQWSPLILNPSYTILHFLGATKVVSAWCFVLAGVFLFDWSWRHALTLLHFPAYHFKTCLCCFKTAEVHNSLLTVDTFPTILSSLGKKLPGNPGCEHGRLPSSQNQVDESCMTLCKHAASTCLLGLNILQWL